MFNIERLSEAGALARLPELIELLQDTVNNGPSIGFIPPLQSETAAQYWLRTISEVADGERVLLVSKESNTVTGSVQLALTTKQNGLHRAEIQKLLVHTRFRGRGIGRALLFEIEEVAAEIGRTLLVPDTEQGSVAENLYSRMGTNGLELFRSTRLPQMVR